MPVIPGSAEPDDIPGTPDNDTIHGYAGDDTLGGGFGDDLIYGGAGNDQIGDGFGQDSVYGGRDDDVIVAFEDLSYSYGGDGNDQIRINEIFFWTTGTQAQAFGGNGDDSISIVGPKGAIARGGDGIDVLAVTAYLTGVDDPAFSIDISTGAGSAVGSGEMQLDFAGFERLYFVGQSGADTITGGALDDTIYGGRGANLLQGGAGDDRMAFGYGGQQTLDGGADDDLLIVYDATMPVYFIVDGVGSVDDGQLSVITGFERYEIEGSTLGDVVRTADGDDLVLGFKGNDVLSGAAGNDSLVGAGGHDEMWGEEGADTLSGGNHDDTLYGGDGNDKLIDGAGDDNLRAGDGDDVLVIGFGSDYVFGDAGADVFRFRELPDPGRIEDRIGDFLSGTDRLVFHQDILLGSPEVGRTSPAEFSIGTQVGTGGQFLYIVSGSSGILYWDGNGTDAGMEQVLVVLQLDSATATVAAGDIFIT